MRRRVYYVRVARGGGSGRVGLLVSLQDSFLSLVAFGAAVRRRGSTLWPVAPLRTAFPSTGGNGQTWRSVPPCIGSAQAAQARHLAHPPCRSVPVVRVFLKTGVCRRNLWFSMDCSSPRRHRALVRGRP